MGLYRRDYIVVGTDLTNRPDDYYKGDIDDLCYEYYWQDRVGDIVFIDDIYERKYFIIGEVLQYSEGHNGGLDYDLIGKEEEIEYATIRVRSFLKEHFNIDCNPYIIIKTQWS